MQGPRGEMMMLRRWAVREHFVSGAYLWKYLSDFLKFYTQHL